MRPTLRLLPFAAADGPSNMAADEALLETASDRGGASLRFYTWTEPTLSLGYFQSAGVRMEVPSLDRLAWVRRSTGGGGIVHHHELTYALALPAGKEWYSAEPWVCRFHHLLRTVLAEQGVRAHAVICGEERKLGGVLCFLHQTPGDLLIDGSKVAGSAQRKWKGALLQHGSILLARSEFAPQLPGINDAAGRELFTPETLADLLADQLAADTGWRIESGDWTAEELARVPAIRAEKYANRDWNGKR
ncbi:MAG: lipM [Gemmataceae bacterium]|nr:lipM [Gemmataceae bacterium]